VERPSPDTGAGSPQGSSDAGPRSEPAGGTPGPEEDAELAARLAAMQEELANAPVEVVVANHCYGLFELAAVYLAHQPSLLPQARLAIDALGILVDGLSGRLGDAEAQLKEGLNQLRLAYVQIDGAQRAGAEVASAAGANGGTTGGDGTPGPSSRHDG
jgi:hypothetical protein